MGLRMTIKDYASVEEAVRQDLDGLTLNDENQARAQIALALARTLDDTRGATSGAAQQSVAGTSKELRSTLQEIGEHLDGDDTFLKGLMG